MEGVTGVFHQRESAEHAVAELRAAGFNDHSIVFLTPDTGDSQVRDIPTTDAEDPGIGTAVSTVVGGALGAGAGMGLGTAIAGLLIPGIGPIFATGVAAATVLGIGGGALGAKLGKGAETTLDEGVPADEVARYHDLLRRGRTLVVALANTVDGREKAQDIFKRNHGEPIEDLNENAA